jgi:hypothetical protein
VDIAFPDNSRLLRIFDSETSPLSIVATDTSEIPVFGFCAFSNGPPGSIDHLLRQDSAGGQDGSKSSSSSDSGPLACGDWEGWVKARYETKDVTVGKAWFQHRLTMLTILKNAVHSGPQYQVPLHFCMRP